MRTLALIVIATCLGAALGACERRQSDTAPLPGPITAHKSSPIAEPVALSLDEYPLRAQALAPNTPLAVVELFTSQGCSSCPPADAQLRRIATASSGEGRVIALSFHVDYWNDLGWRDPFSDESYSERQRWYARRLRSSRVYTPQMVVNGTREFVGSNQSLVDAALRNAFEDEHVAEVALGALVRGKSLVVGVEVTNALPGSFVQVALVQRERENHVERGENAGRTLRHVNIVRQFASMSLKPRLQLSFDRVPGGSRVVAYVQHPETLAVLGANALDLP